MNFHFFSQEICGIINYMSGVGSTGVSLKQQKRTRGNQTKIGGGKRDKSCPFE